MPAHGRTSGHAPRACVAMLVGVFFFDASPSLPRRTEPGVRLSWQFLTKIDHRLAALPNENERGILLNRDYFMAHRRHGLVGRRGSFPMIILRRFLPRTAVAKTRRQNGPPLPSRHTGGRPRHPLSAPSRWKRRRASMGPAPHDPLAPHDERHRTVTSSAPTALSPTSLLVRLATEADVESIRSVYAPYVAEPVTFDVEVPSEHAFDERMRAVMPAYPCLVLERDGRVTGFAYAHAQAERAAYRWNAELSVYLEQASTGCGGGRALYAALLDLLGMQGIRSAYALVTVPNGASERLHESLGFERSWVQPHAGWKAGAWHDVAWYAKALAPFDDRPADPVPFDSLVREQGKRVQAVLDRANAALAVR